MVERVDAEAADHGRADEALFDGALEGGLVQAAGEIGGGDEALSGETTRRGLQGPDRLAAQGCADGVGKLDQGGHARSAGKQEDVRHDGEITAEARVAPPHEADAAVGLLIALEAGPALGRGSWTNAHGCSSAGPASRWRTVNPRS